MKRKLLIATVSGIASVLIAGFGFAQYWQREGEWRGGRNRYESRDRTPRDARGGVPEWERDAEFKHDVFTFVRIEYSSYRDSWRRPKWETDWPDSDLNFSYRLQELTSLKVDPDGKILRLTNPELFDYPFIYIIEPGRMMLEDEEVTALRRYLLNGGFLMVDDFWTRYERDHFDQQMQRVFPKRQPQELPLEHDIFHCVYDLKEKPQIPSIHHYWHGARSERGAGPASYRGIFDDDGRMMVIICHNTDLGDGWEREGLDAGYFKEYSEKWAYPLGINIVTYAMTH